MISVRADFSRNFATKLRISSCFFVLMDGLRPKSVSTSIGILLDAVKLRSRVRK